MTRNLPKEVLLARREQERPGLNFLAMLCFLQYFMGRMFLLESSGASVIFGESPLGTLGTAGLTLKAVGSMHVWGAARGTTHQEEH